MAKPRKYSYQGTNGWGFLRDVFIHAMNKGQLLPAVLGMVFIILIIKLPSEDASKLIFQILSDLKRWYLTGWGLFGIILLLWAWHSKFKRRVHEREVSRIANQKTELQKKDLGKMVQSSR